MVTKIIRTKNNFEILVSEEDYELVSLYNWHLTNKGYARSQLPRKNKQQTHIMLHRLIVKAKPFEIVDHINRIKTDNRRENLRIVSSFENSLNQKKQKNRSSKFKGVTKISNGWQVSANGIYVGVFQDEKKAAEKYDEIILNYFGDKAITNKLLGLL